ncbi:MAG: DUF169 domain-containing protein [Candidatus Kariarchaeaceae archaeon]
MEKLSGKLIAEKIKNAALLKSEILFIYGVDKPPEKAVSSMDIHRCIAYSIFSLTSKSDTDAIYIERDDNRKRKWCPGGQAWLGFKDFLPMLHYFISSGSKNSRNGAAENLIASPELAEKRLKSTKSITPLGKYIVVQKSSSLSSENLNPNAFLCFGTAEQIRNLSSLFYFRSEKSFDVQFPWGPYCASFISYPANMIEGAPQNKIILGPTDPTGERWFPQEYLSMGIPFEIAEQMAKDIDSSFLSA